MEINSKYHTRRSVYDSMILDCLERTLEKNKISKSNYNLRGYGEDKFCMEKRKNNWISYYGSHGKEVDIKVFPNIRDAAINFIDNLVESENESKKLIRQFRAYVNRSSAHARVRLSEKLPNGEDSIMMPIERHASEEA